MKSYQLSDILVICYVPSDVLVTLYNPNVEPCRIQLKTSFSVKDFSILMYTLFRQRFYYCILKFLNDLG